MWPRVKILTGFNHFEIQNAQSYQNSKKSSGFIMNFNCLFRMLGIAVFLMDFHVSRKSKTASLNSENRNGFLSVFDFILRLLPRNE